MMWSLFLSLVLILHTHVKLVGPIVFPLKDTWFLQELLYLLIIKKLGYGENDTVLNTGVEYKTQENYISLMMLENSRKAKLQYKE